MTDRVYVCPISCGPVKQFKGGAYFKIGNGLIGANSLKIIHRKDDQTLRTHHCTVETVLDVIQSLPITIRDEAMAQWVGLRSKRADLQIGRRCLSIDSPKIMGILNMTPDSFSDGGKFTRELHLAQKHVQTMVDEGASIIDIGGESTRPGATSVSEEEEKRRIMPAVEYCASAGLVVSVDTRRSGVLEAALRAGAQMANDISGMQYDPRSMSIASAANCPVILMHTPGHGSNPHQNDGYKEVVFDVFDALKKLRDQVIEKGVKRSQIILDPGLGFGKNLSDNLAIVNSLGMFHSLGQPLILGASRKRLIGALSQDAPVHKRLGGSVALAIVALNSGVQLLRVHDVAETVQARDVWLGLCKD